MGGTVSVTAIFYRKVKMSNCTCSFTWTSKPRGYSRGFGDDTGLGSGSGCGFGFFNGLGHGNSCGHGYGNGGVDGDGYGHGDVLPDGEE